jgi:hypothetical protein
MLLQGANFGQLEQKLYQIVDSLPIFRATIESVLMKRFSRDSLVSIFASQPFLRKWRTWPSRALM